MSMKSLSISQNLVWNTFGNIVYLGAQWLMSYATIMLLGYSNGGIYSLAMSVSTSISTIALFGMRNYQVADVSNTFSDKAYYYSRIITSGVSFASCLVFLYLNQYNELTVIAVCAYMLFKISEAFGDVFQGTMQRNLRMDYIGISFILKGTIECIGYIATLIIFRNLFVSLCSLVVISTLIVYFFDFNIALRFNDGASISARVSQEVRKLLLTCIPIAGYSILFNVAGQLPRYYIELSLGSEMLGFYTSVALPVTIVQVGANFLFTPLTTPMALCLNEGEIAKFKRIINKIFFSVILLGFVALAFFWFFSSWFYSILFGSGILPYMDLVIPLVLSGVLIALSWFLSNMLIVSGRLHVLLLSSAIEFLTTLLFCLPAINCLGMNGATFIHIASLSIFCIICFADLFRFVGSREGVSE